MILPYAESDARLYCHHRLQARSTIRLAEPGAVISRDVYLQIRTQSKWKGGKITSRPLLTPSENMSMDQEGEIKVSRLTKDCSSEVVGDKTNKKERSRGRKIEVREGRESEYI
jgi:hypothetical protein